VAVAVQRRARSTRRRRRTTVGDGSGRTTVGDGSGRTTVGGAIRPGAWGAAVCSCWISLRKRGSLDEPAKERERPDHREHEEEALREPSGAGFRAQGKEHRGKRKRSALSTRREACRSTNPFRRRSKISAAILAC